MKISETFHIRRYWISEDIPQDMLDTLNWHWGFKKFANKRSYYVDVNYHGDSDKMLTMMELKYTEWITDREELTYTVEGDDGLT